MGLINAVGNLGGYFGPLIVGYFLKRSGGFVYGFGSLGIALIVGAALSFMLRPAENTGG
jgi:MFS-type transporter involved in bile tolerance (Atg22 family)